MENSLFADFFGSGIRIRVVDFLIGNSIFDYTKTDIAENSDVSRASLYAVWPQLEQYGIMKASRKIGNTTLYRLDKVRKLCPLLEIQ